MSGDNSGPKSARTVLLHPYVEVAVLETARGGILREGLAFDSCSVGVVTNVTSDHLGLKGINTLEELARVKQVVIEAVRDDGAAVLNADDPLVAEMAAATDARVIYFSLNPKNHIIAAHLTENGEAVFIRDNTIVLAKDGSEIELVELDRLPFTAKGKIRFQITNALAATAAAWGAGLNPAMIARALTTFHTDYEMVPGRFNLTEVNGIQIITDYGHNTAAMAALMEAAQALGERNTIFVGGFPGDRRDADLISTIMETVPVVSRYFLYDLKDRRGRDVGEVPNLLKHQLPQDVPCEIVSDEHTAIYKAWKAARPGDRLIVIVDLVDESIEILNRLISHTAEDDGCTLPLSQMHSEVVGK